MLPTRGREARLFCSPPNYIEEAKSHNIDEDGNPILDATPEEQVRKPLLDKPEVPMLHRDC